MHVLLVANDQILELQGVQDAVTGEYQSAATVTATVLKTNGDEVEGETWPVTLSYVADSDGNYRGLLNDEVQLQPGKFYIVDIDVDAGGGLRANWHYKAVAQYRTP